MQTRILMAASALFMAVLGATASFLPEEILRYTGTVPAPLINSVVQACGALYLGFAILNWMARGVLIGGIYARPLALGNFLHFFVVAVTLIKVLFELRLPLIVGLTISYTVLAAWFGLVLFTHPGRSQRDP
jgi:hypothetical protein